MPSTSAGGGALILYATETGTAQDIATSLRPLLNQYFSPVEVIPADDLPSPSHLHHYTLCVFVIATSGQGDIPTNARRFWRMLLRKRLVVGKELEGVRFASVGLGDRSYLKFNWAARKVRKRLVQLGAEEVGEGCEADESGEEGVEGGVNEWLRGFEGRLREGWVRRERVGEGWEVDEGARWLLGPASGLEGEGGGERSREWSRPPLEDEFPATLTHNERLTPSDHWQDVRLLRFHSSQDLDYLPGDALALLPENDPQDVETCLQLMKWTEVADIPLELKELESNTTTKNSISQSQPYPRLEKPPLPHLTQSTSEPGAQSTTTLRSLLTNTLDIRAIPRRSFFRNLARYCTEDEFQRDRLLEFTDPQYLDEYFDYATRPRRSIIEILQEFTDGVRVPWQEVLEIVPLLRPRLFSIASSRTVAGNQNSHMANRHSSGTGTNGEITPTGGTTFELLVAVVKYRTVIRRIRRGVCTRWLDKLPVGTKLNIALRTEGRFIKNRNVLQAQRKHILVGAGTGLAPLRSLIWEKKSMGLHQNDNAAGSALTNGHGETWPLDTPTSSQRSGDPNTLLIFGARNATQDFFFSSEWEHLATAHQPAFKLLTAFSRDQTQKIYIQDRIRENGALVRRMIVEEDAVLVVCGSAGAMPKAVRGALVDVLRGRGEGGEEEKEVMSEEQAERYVERMEKEGRYLQETWS